MFGIYEEYVNSIKWTLVEAGMGAGGSWNGVGMGGERSMGRKK